MHYITFALCFCQDVVLLLQESSARVSWSHPSDEWRLSAGVRYCLLRRLGWTSWVWWKWARRWDPGPGWAGWADGWSYRCPASESWTPRRVSCPCRGFERSRGSMDSCSALKHHKPPPRSLKCFFILKSLIQFE